MNAAFHIGTRGINGFHSCFLLTTLVFLQLAGCSQETESVEPEELESLSISLNQSVLREPLVNVVLPRRADQQIRVTEEDGTTSRKETRDRVEFVNDGMLVTQPARPEGASRVSGFKVLVPAEGDFEFDLKCLIKRLDQPTTPQGAHGLSMRFLFEESGPELVVLGCMSSKNCERCLVKRVKQKGEKAQQTMVPLEFKSGTWKIKRQGSVLSLLVEARDGELLSSEVVEGVTGRLDAIEVWCSRLPKGNAHAEILLNSFTMRAAKLFPSEKLPPSYLHWIQYGFVLLVIVLAIWAYRARQ